MVIEDDIAYRKGHRYHGRGTPGEVLRPAGRRAGPLPTTSAATPRNGSTPWSVSARRPRSSAWTHFHVVAWAIKALDKLRVRTMTKAGITDRHAMWAVHKTRPI